MAEQTPWNDGLDQASTVLALENLEGVGRVTVRRLLGQFSDVGEVGTLPREQVLNRLKGIPNAANLVDRLADDEGMKDAAAGILKRIEAWSARKIEIATWLDEEGWPGALDRLPNPHRPNVLYSYGSRESLSRPHAAIIAVGELEPGPFEEAQTLIRMLLGKGIGISVGTSTGFDVVGIKLSEAGGVPPVLVASCGLAKIEQAIRPHASAVVKSGGLMVSSLPMDQGPFDHDRREGSLVQAALATAVVFVDPKPGSFDWTALEWALEVNKPVFAIVDGGEGVGAEIPDRVHVIRDEVDREWVMAAVKLIG